MEIDFLKCKTCIVQANCSLPCEEYRYYIFKKTGIKFDHGHGIKRQFMENLIRSASNIQIHNQQSYTMDIDLEEFEKC